MKRKKKQHYTAHLVNSDKSSHSQLLHFDEVFILSGSLLTQLSSQCVYSSTIVNTDKYCLVAVGILASIRVPG